MLMGRRKVGVLTFHRCFNYGSYWQARCLVAALAAAGHDVELLEHESAAVAAAELRCLMQPALPVRSPRADLPALKAKGRKFLDAFAEFPVSAPFPLDDPAAAPRYDTIVVGSDEVWNFRHPWYGSQPIFFGDGLDARLVSYAASFGNHDAADGIDRRWSDRLDRFDALSVRDANSHALVHGATGDDPALVLDPVLLHPEAIQPRGSVPPYPYALVYGHGFPDWLAASVARWSQETGIPLVSVGYRNAFAAEQRLDAGPHEFAALMAGAAAVITNFFHGCVFALVNGKPWISAPSPYRFNKIRDLAAKLGAEDHIVSAATDLNPLLATPPSADVAARIAALRLRSHAYLAEALA
jgi:hypothetical protein